MNLVINLLLFVILCISGRNSNSLKPYQRAYLSFSIIFWLIITIYYLSKLIFLIFIEIKRKKHKVPDVEKIFKIFKLCWLIIFGLVFLFMFIGFIYDIVKIIKGQLGSAVYPIIYFIVCFAYVILSFFDNIFNRKYIYLTLDNLKVVKESDLDEDQEVKESEAKEIKDDSKNENNIHESQKSKNE